MMYHTLCFLDIGGGDCCLGSAALASAHVEDLLLMEYGNDLTGSDFLKQ